MIFKKILYILFGPEKYLMTISRFFFLLYNCGLLKKRFPQHYFIKKLVHEGNYIIDIGANLGYYTLPLSKLCGPSGKIFAVEPVPLFNKILKINANRVNRSNIDFLPYALGKENDINIKMGTPVRDGIYRHGLTKVISPKEADDYFQTCDVIQYNPDVLFRDIHRLDYIKCDVEGYESQILPEFKRLIGKFRPLFQVEISGEANRQILMNFFTSLDYYSCYLDKGKLRLYNSYEGAIPEDFYFIPVEKENIVKENIN